LLSAATVLPVSAGPIAFGTWYEFSFFDAGVPAMGCFPADPDAPECIPSSGTPTVFADAPPWTFVTGADGATLTVTDAFSHGDVFRIFDRGVSIGVTVPASPADDISCGDDPIPCVMDPLTSKGIFSLSSGAHSITINPSASPYGGGVGYFLVNSTTAAVPEPCSFGLIGISVLAGVLGRRKLRGSRFGPNPGGAL
jgi:hypothetical protein